MKLRLYKMVGRKADDTLETWVSSGQSSTTPPSNSAVTDVYVDGYFERWVPTVTSISPTDVDRGSPAQLVNVYGSEFFPSSIVVVDGVDYPTTFVSSTQLQTTLTASDISTYRNIAISVRTPNAFGKVHTGGAASETKTFRSRIAVTGTVTTPSTLERFSGIGGVQISVTANEAIPAGATLTVTCADYLGQPSGEVIRGIEPITLSGTVATFTLPEMVLDEAGLFSVQLVTSGVLSSAATSTVTQPAWIAAEYRGENVVLSTTGVSLWRNNAYRQRRNVAGLADYQKIDANRDAYSGTTTSQPAWLASDSSFGNRPTVSFVRSTNILLSQWMATRPFDDSPNWTGQSLFLARPLSVRSALAAKLAVTSDVTVECWVRFPQAVNSSGMRVMRLGNSYGSSTPSRYVAITLDAQADGSYTFAASASGGNNSVTMTSDAVATLTNTPLTKSKWHHVAVVRASGYWSLYVDGALASAPVLGSAVDLNAPLLVELGGTSSSSIIVAHARVALSALYSGNSYTKPSDYTSAANNSVFYAPLDGDWDDKANTATSAHLTASSNEYRNGEFVVDSPVTKVPTINSGTSLSDRMIQTPCQHYVVGNSSGVTGSLSLPLNQVALTGFNPSLPMHLGYNIEAAGQRFSVWQYPGSGSTTGRDPVTTDALAVANRWDAPKVVSVRLSNASTNNQATVWVNAYLDGMGYALNTQPPLTSASSTAIRNQYGNWVETPAGAMSSSSDYPVYSTAENATAAGTLPSSNTVVGIGTSGTIRQNTWNGVIAHILLTRGTRSGAEHRHITQYFGRRYALPITEPAP